MGKLNFIESFAYLKSNISGTNARPKDRVIKVLANNILGSGCGLVQKGQLLKVIDIMPYCT